MIYNVTILAKLTNKIYRINETFGIHFLQFISPVDTIKIGDELNITGFIIGRSIEVIIYNNIELRKIPSLEQSQMLKFGTIHEGGLGWYLLKNGEVAGGIPQKNNYDIGYWLTEQGAKRFYNDWSTQFIVNREEV